MLWFGERKELENKYYEWVEKESVNDCPFNVICFLQINSLIDVEKARKFIRGDSKWNFAAIL